MVEMDMVGVLDSKDLLCFEDNVVHALPLAEKEDGCIPSESEESILLNYSTEGGQQTAQHQSPYIWHQTASSLDDTERSPYEDFVTACPHFRKDRAAYEDWLKWSSARSHSRCTSLQAPLPLFSRFAQLPPELRLKVWASALPGPRVARVEAHSEASLQSGDNDDHLNGTNDDSDHCNVRFTTSLLNPITLSINHESRSLTLQHYRLIPSIRNPGTNTSIYYSKTTDILFPTPNMTSKTQDNLTKLLNSLSHEAVRPERVALLLNDLDILYPTITLFPSCTDLIIILTKNGNEFDGDNDALTLEEFDIFANSSSGVVSTVLDMEIAFFTQKWYEKCMLETTKMPKMSFAMLENERVKSPGGIVRYADL